MRDAIANEAEGIAANTDRAASRDGRVERLTSEIADIDQRVKRAARAPETGCGAGRLRADRAEPAFFWSFAILLTLVEFFANFPVFRLLLPLKPALAKAAQVVAENSATANGGPASRCS